MAEKQLEGGCQCGAVRYRVSGEPVMAALCHCSLCRRANAAPAVAWAMYTEPQVSFPEGKPQIYESSPGARRGCRFPIQPHRLLTSMSLHKQLPVHPSGAGRALRFAAHWPEKRDAVRRGKSSAWTTVYD